MGRAIKRDNVKTLFVVQRGGGATCFGSASMCIVNAQTLMLEADNHLNLTQLQFRIKLIDGLIGAFTVRQRNVAVEGDDCTYKVKRTHKICQRNILQCPSFTGLQQGKYGRKMGELDF